MSIIQAFQNAPQAITPAIILTAFVGLCLYVLCRFMANEMAK